MKVKTRRTPSLIGKLLWSLCLMQVIVLVLLIGGLLYIFVDNKYQFIDDSVTDLLVENLTVQPGYLAFVQSKPLQNLLDTHPEFWAVAADAQGHRVQLGNVPEHYRILADNLNALSEMRINALPGRSELVMRIIIKKIQGQTIHLMAGAVAVSEFNRAIVLITKLLTPFFVVPMLLLTLIATPIIVLRATKGVRQLARETRAIDISSLGTHLSEHAVPREVQPLVTAFNGAMSRLAKTYHARDRFLRDAAHELRMPIAILMARIESMPVHPVKAALLTDLSRLANIAEQLLDVQKLQGLSVELAPVDLVALVRNVVADMAPLVLAQSDDLILNVPDHPVPILGQASALSRVVTNLVQNALVHGEGGAITVTVDSSGSFTVADRGKGIPVEDHEHIFNPFYRGSTDRPGHGLGLHLAQEIVLAHNGQISVAEGANGGAEFTVQLEQCEPAESVPTPT